MHIKCELDTVLLFNGKPSFGPPEAVRLVQSPTELQTSVGVIHRVNHHRHGGTV